jgi:hypothetical protein
MSDTVRCDYCKGRLQRWEASDDPLEEHHRHYPRCPFLIPLIQETHNPDWAEYGTRLRSFEEENWNASHSTPSAEELGKNPLETFSPRKQLCNLVPSKLSQCRISFRRRTRNANASTSWRQSREPRLQKRRHKVFSLQHDAPLMGT